MDRFGESSDTFSSLARQKESLIEEGHVMAGSCAYDDIDTAKVCSCTGCRLHQGQKRDPYSPAVFGKNEKLCGSALLGERVLCLYGRKRRSGGDPELHPPPGAGRSAE